MEVKIIRILLISLLTFQSIFSYADSSKTILVTSSTGALGSAISKDLADKGYNLILAGREDLKLNSLKKSLLSKTKVETLKLDYNDFESIARAADHLQESSIDGMVIIPPRPFFNSKDIPSSDQWRDNFESGFITPLEFIKLASRKIKCPGALVIISGETSKTYIPHYPNSNIIKLMWSGEIKNLCHQYSHQNLRVNSLSPGVILTAYHIDRIKNMAIQKNRSFDEELAFETKDLPSKKHGEPKDVADVVRFLLSDESKHMNCENIVLNGGGNRSY